MNNEQFDKIAERLIKSPQQRFAVKEVILNNKRPFEVEIALYGRQTKSVSRDVKRVNNMFEFCEGVING